jgi:hypothetical protein
VGGQSIEVETGGCVLNDACFIANGIAVPTLSQWGLIVLALLSTIIGLLFIQRPKLIPIKQRVQRK